MYSNITIYGHWHIGRRGLVQPEQGLWRCRRIPSSSLRCPLPPRSETAGMLSWTVASESLGLSGTAIKTQVYQLITSLENQKKMECHLGQSPVNDWMNSRLQLRKSEQNSFHDNFLIS